MVDQFNNSPSTFVFLISSNAGGVGLNLTGNNLILIRGLRPRPSGMGKPPCWLWMIRQPRCLLLVQNGPAAKHDASVPCRLLCATHISCKLQPDACRPPLSALQPPTRSSFSTHPGTQPWTCVSVLFFTRTRGCAFVDCPANRRWAPSPSEMPLCAQHLCRFCPAFLSRPASRNFSITLSACSLPTPQRRRTARSGWARRGTSACTASLRQVGASYG